MPELNDRQTDELFQAGAERHGFQYNEAAWNQMTELLDADLAHRRRRIVRTLVGAGVFLAVVVLVWLNLSTSGSTPSLHSTGSELSAVSAGSGEDHKPSNFSGSQTAGNNEPTVSTGNKTDAGPLAITPRSRSGRDGAARAGAMSGSESRPTPTDATTVAPSEGLEPRNLSKAKTFLKANTSGQGLDGPEEEPESVDPDREESSIRVPGNRRPVTQAVRQLPQTPLSPLKAAPADPGNNLVVTGADEHGNSAEETFKKQSSKNNLILAVGGGTILGRVGDDPFQDVRPRFGLDLEYRIGKRWAVSVGGYYNSVSLRTKMENYSPKEGFWSQNQNIKPDMIKGRCNVIELPLTLKYYFNNSAADGWYVAGGATSYFVLREDFWYFYDQEPPAGVDFKENWTGNETNRHPFGFGQLAMGYQKRLKNRSGIRLEAFIQLPVSGIGHGDVRLLTTGISANYQFGLR